MKKIYVVFPILLSLLIACSKGPPVPFRAFDFTVEDIFTGEEIHLENLMGRPLILYFFASW
ncbi:MAG: hypothetical protein Fur0020_10910 [Thermodesulfovibrionia bacterium]